MPGLRNNCNKILITTYLNYNLIIRPCSALVYNNAFFIPLCLYRSQWKTLHMPVPLCTLGMSQLLRTERFSHQPLLWRVNLHHKAFSKQLTRTVDENVFQSIFPGSWKCKISLLQGARPWWTNGYTWPDSSAADEGWPRTVGTMM